MKFWHNKHDELHARIEDSLNDMLNSISLRLSKDFPYKGRNLALNDGQIFMYSVDIFERFIYLEIKFQKIVLYVNKLNCHRDGSLWDILVGAEFQANPEEIYTACRESLREFFSGIIELMATSNLSTEERSGIFSKAGWDARADVPVNPQALKKE